MIENNDLKQRIAKELPYKEWLTQFKTNYNFDQIDYKASTWSDETLFNMQRQFAYTKEDIYKYMQELVVEKKDPIGAMGFDAPIAVLNERPESLFNYFKQLFAQVTNPPIDAYREKIVTSELSYLGGEGNLLQPDPAVLHRIQLKRPVLMESHLESIDTTKFKVTYLSTLYQGSLKEALETLGTHAIKAVRQGAQILVLDDSRLINERSYAMPILLAISYVHQLLISENLRMETSLIAKSGETREVHHIACLLGYGANAIIPYLAQRTVEQLTTSNHLTGQVTDNVKTYTDVLSEGVIKVMAKMGISTVQSYQGAQIFEAIGLSDEVINTYFTGTQSKLSGLSIEQIDQENKQRQSNHQDYLESGSTFQWRQQGQHHTFNPQTIFLLQHACRDNDYELYKSYSATVNDRHSIDHIRDLLEFKSCQPIDIEQVEPVSEIVKRFNTGAMSYGSISAEAHETLAQAMNQLGGKSNSGEGGEDGLRYQPQQDGSNKSSAIKQVASGRFGVTSDYLQHAKEIQIKVAQGAKPGEGGQLPGSKVYPWIAKTRGSTPGIGLISPPPHHDIYSIEDLAQLIHDLKNANRDADIAVKLVSKTGVGTIASGVAKAFADKIVISGYDGGTGASPKTSIQHAGVPWEIGLAETHQTLKLNDLRSRVKLETDGKLLTGKDVAYACALGAEEYGFATAPLIVLGCIMMRVCHKDTCPVGVATQNQDLRALFRGKAHHVVNFMHFIAQELREILASLGLKRVEELIGRTDLLQRASHIDPNSKAASLKVERLLASSVGHNTKVIQQNHHLDTGFDLTYLYQQTKPFIATGQTFKGEYTVNNEQRDVGVIIGSEITKLHGVNGLPENTINLYTHGHAGQSLAAYAPKGLTIVHTGDANDYVGKGLSGGTVVVAAPYQERQNEIIAGNVSFYGASSGKAFINGKAGERFCIRNSGVDVVVEGIGDHGLEYMTGGHVIILGDVGKNFGQGMSGGVCYVFPTDTNEFMNIHQLETLEFSMVNHELEKHFIKHMLQSHVEFTNSTKAQHILKHFDESVQHIIKVIPKDYQLMMQKIEVHKRLHRKEDDALLAAFYDESKQITATEQPAVVY